MANKLQVAGCDYFRASACHERLWPEWQAIFLAARLKENLNGRKDETRWLYGYYGIMLEHAFAGVGKQGMLLQFSGETADRYWESAAHDTDHVARMDIQVTLPMGPKQWEYVEAAYHECAERPKRRGNQLEPEMFLRPSGARGVSFGSRKSAVYGRIYDKERESGKEDYPGCVRWEVEYHNDAAGNVCRYLQERGGDRGVAAELVGRQFEQWGVRRQWEASMAFEAPPMAKGRRTYESREAWLATQVSPTLKYLVENNRSMEAANALLTAFDIISPDDVRLGQLSKLLRMCILEGR